MIDICCESPQSDVGVRYFSILIKCYCCAGVIQELARERIAREGQLSQRNGKSVEQVAKLTQDLVENRDIKALVKSVETQSDEIRSEEGAASDPGIRLCSYYCETSYCIMVLGHLTRVCMEVRR